MWQVCYNGYMVNNDFIGTAKAAKILGVSKNTILRWIETGYLKGVHLGIGKGIWRIKESDCLALLSNGVNTERNSQ